MLCPPWFPVPPPRYGGIEAVVALLTDGLVARGHEVTLFASGDSSTRARLIATHARAPSAQLGETLPELRHTLACMLRAREFEYVHAARALGAGTPRILWRHVVPAAVPALVVQATLGMAGAIIGEAALSFLGLGVQPPTPSWGTMLNGGRAHILDAPHLTLFPGLAIALLVLGFNFLGDGLRDRLDPRRQL